MNVAVLSFHRLGGSGIIAHDIANELAKKCKINIHFVGLKPPYRMEQVSRECRQNVKFHKIVLKPYAVFDFQPYVMALASQLSELIVKHNINVIHSHYAIPHALAGILAKQIAGRKDVRTVVTLHGTDVTIVGSDTSMKPITNYSIMNSDHVVAVSEYLRELTVNFLDVPKSKIQVIPNFVNMQHVPRQRQATELYVSAGQKKLILHSSNLRKIKGPLDVIEIYHKMLERGLRNSELGIMGKGPYLEKMKARVAALGIGEQVIFFGERKDIYEHLSEATLFLLPSRGESFGLAALEAMACGVPVIAMALGGVMEVITHGENGFLFPENDLAAAADYGVKLIGDKALYRKISENARSVAKDKFPMEKVLLAYEKLYGL